MIKAWPFIRLVIQLWIIVVASAYIGYVIAVVAH
jgi:hypothetical protein